MANARSVLGALAALVLVTLPGCGDSPPARSAQTEMVPSNSAFESQPAKPQIVSEPTSNDPAPAQPQGQGGAPTPLAGSGGPTQGATPPAPATPPPVAPPAGADKGKPSKAECQAVLDRYLDLEIKSRPELKGIAPDMMKGLIAQSKQQAGAQKGDPCTDENLTRAKVACGMKATTPDQWKACMQ